MNKELAKPESPIMKHFINYFYLAQGAEKEKRFKESQGYYEKILQIGNMMYQEAEVYVRGRVELEEKLSGYNRLALACSKKGRLNEACALRQKMIEESQPQTINKDCRGHLW